MDAVVWLSLILPGIGLVQSALMLIHAWEHRRFHRSRRTNRIKAPAELSVALVAPCKGLDADLAANLQALFRQWYPRFELCFVVESENDAAIGVIRSVAREYPQIPHRIVTAGLARDCGQKVHNLMVAVDALLYANSSGERPPLPPLPKGGSSLPDVLAFVDSDACPHTEWLARLVERLVSGKHAVATGYRWYLPAEREPEIARNNVNEGVNCNPARPPLPPLPKGGSSWANRLLSAINNTVIGVMGPHGFNLVWGGAWAIRTQDFKTLGLPAAWNGSLSDDLVVSRLVHEAGLKVGYEPNCLVKSTADFNWSRLAEFLRRQFVVVRVYAPLWWWFGFCTGLVTNVCFWGTPVLACILAANDGPWAVPAFGGLLWYLEGIGRAQMTSRAVRPFVIVSKHEYRRVARVNVWGWPLVSLAAWLSIVSGAIGRAITWRGIRYRLDSPQKTTILGNSADAGNLANGEERDSHARTTTKAA